MKKALAAFALSLILLFAPGKLFSTRAEEYTGFGDDEADVFSEFDEEEFPDAGEELFDEETEFHAAQEQGRRTENMNAASGYMNPDLMFDGEYGYFVSEDRTSCVTALYRGEETKVEIPSRLGGLPVSEIGDHTFANNTFIETVIIPDGVRIIGKQAFFRCSSLQSIHLPEGVTEIGDQCFGGCSRLDEVIVPQSLETVGSMAFLGCFALREITFGNGLKTIGDNAFHTCSALGRVIVPSEDVSIEPTAFEECPEEMELIYADRM